MSHSRFSPSSTEREYDCPASFLLNEGLPDRQSAEAAHGTAAHYVAKLALEKGVDVDHYASCQIAVDRKGRERFVTALRPKTDDDLVFEVDDEMIDNVQGYVTWCRELPGDHYVETRIEHTRWCPDVDEFGDPLDPQYGTSDHVACIPAGRGPYDESTIVVTDLKYGKGVRVTAKENKQAIKYALGAYDRWNWVYDFKKVVIRICQPRLGVYETWTLTVEELLEWGRKIKDRLSLVFDEDAPFGPTEKACKFCRVLACKARTEYLYRHAVVSIDDETGEPQAVPYTLDEDQLLEAHRLLPLLEIHASHIRAEVLKRLSSDRPVGELFLVESSTTRRWSKPEKEVERELLKAGIAVSEMRKQVFVSPAQAEDLLPKQAKHGGKRVTKRERAEIVNKMACSPAGYPVVAQPGDKRKRYVKPELSLDGLDDL